MNGDPAGGGAAGDQPTPDPVSGVSARQLADRVVSCPDVAGLSGGPFGTVASYLPGDHVPGIALRDDGIEIHVIARYGRPLPEIADRVRDAVSELTGGRRVNVTIADVTTTTTDVRTTGDTGKD